MDVRLTAHEILNDRIKEMGLEPDAVVVFSNKEDICDYQSNYALIMAKKMGKNPIVLAENIVKGIRSQDFDFDAFNGFINIKVKDQFLSRFANEVLKDDRGGVKKHEKSKVVFFDYGGANIAKSLHVGHLRTPIVGEALKRLHNFLGDKTYADTHLGDYGLQMGLTILQMQQDGFLDDFFSINADYKNIPLNITLDVLNEEYPKASKRKEIDKEFEKLAEDYTLKIQQKIEPYWTIYKKIREISVKTIEKNYKELGCSFDFWYGESDASAYVDDVIKIFKDKKLAKESEGALIVDVAVEGENIPLKSVEGQVQRYKNPMPPVLLKKHNGADLYATTDIATIYQRNRDFSLDEIVYITDNRQGMHFTQVFRASKLAGISPENQKLSHIVVGTMNGLDGKPFKTRSGETVKLQDVIDLITSKASEKMKANGLDPSREVALKIGVGAMRFGDLINNVSKNYIFDLDRFLAFEGKTGPYLQYTVARINSILAKTSVKGDKIYIRTKEERKIILELLKLISSYEICYSEYSLNTLALSAYNFASAFSSFYNNISVLKEQDNKRKVELVGMCTLVKKCLLLAMNILAIEEVEKM